MQYICQLPWLGIQDKFDNFSILKRNNEILFLLNCSMAFSALRKIFQEHNKISDISAQSLCYSRERVKLVSNEYPVKRNEK